MKWEWLAIDIHASRLLFESTKWTSLNPEVTIMTLRDPRMKWVKVIDEPGVMVYYQTPWLSKDMRILFLRTVT